MQPQRSGGEVDALAVLAWIRGTAAGRQLLRAAEDAVGHGEELPAATRLRAGENPARVAFAFGQAELRSRAVGKFGADAASMWFTRDGLEQASSSLTARHRAARLTAAGPAAGQRVLDLCCGIGGDLIAAVRSGAAVTGVDHDPLHLAMAMASVQDLGLRAEGALADVRAVVLDGDDAVILDPARRRAGRRLTTGDTEPPLRWCLGLPVARVAVKAAPGLDRALLPADWQVEFVAVGRDLKESVLWSPALRDGGTASLATVLTGGGASSLGDDGVGPAPVTPVRRWLLDPSPAIGRAGAVDTLARVCGAGKIDDRIAFLTADDPVATDFARLLRVEADLPFDVRRLRHLLSAHDVGAADIRRRGLAGDVELLRSRLRLRGSRRVTLVMTRVAEAPWALVCVDPDDPPL